MKDLSIKFEVETGWFVITNWAWNRTHKWNEWRRPTMEQAVELVEQLEKM